MNICKLLIFLCKYCLNPLSSNKHLNRNNATLSIGALLYKESRYFFSELCIVKERQLISIIWKLFEPFYSNYCDLLLRKHFCCTENVLNLFVPCLSAAVQQTKSIQAKCTYKFIAAHKMYI